MTFFLNKQAKSAKSTTSTLQTSPAQQKIPQKIDLLLYLGCTYNLPPINYAIFSPPGGACTQCTPSYAYEILLSLRARCVFGQRNPLKFCHPSPDLDAVFSCVRVALFQCSCVLYVTSGNYYGQCILFFNPSVSARMLSTTKLSG